MNTKFTNLVMHLSHIPQCNIKKCAHFCSKWSIVIYKTGALWDLWEWPISNTSIGIFLGRVGVFIYKSFSTNMHTYANKASVMPDLEIRSITLIDIEGRHRDGCPSSATTNCWNVCSYTEHVHLMSIRKESPSSTKGTIPFCALVKGLK